MLYGLNTSYSKKHVVGLENHVIGCDDFKPVVHLSDQDIVSVPLTHAEWICFEDSFFRIDESLNQKETKWLIKKYLVVTALASGS